jgi:hypothetical protein
LDSSIEENAENKVDYTVFNKFQELRMGTPGANVINIYRQNLTA